MASQDPEKPEPEPTAEADKHSDEAEPVLDKAGDWREVLLFSLWCLLFYLSMSQARPAMTYAQAEQYRDMFVNDVSGSRTFFEDIHTYDEIQAYLNDICLNLFDVECSTTDPLPCQSGVDTADNLKGCKYDTPNTVSRIGGVVFQQNRVDSFFDSGFSKTAFTWKGNTSEWTSEYTPSPYGGSFRGDLGTQYDTDGYYLLVPPRVSSGTCSEIVDSMFAGEDPWISPKHTRMLQMMAVVSPRYEASHKTASTWKVFFEFPTTGGIRPGYSFGMFMQYDVVTMAFVYFLMGIFLIRSLQKLRKKRLRFFGDVWNCVDVCIYLMSGTCLISFILMQDTWSSLQDVNTVCEDRVDNGMTPFASVDEEIKKINYFWALLKVSDQYTICFGVNSLFMAVRLLGYYSFVPYLTLAVHTLVNIGKQLTVFVVITAFNHIAVSAVIFTIYYDSLRQFSTYAGTYCELLYSISKTTAGFSVLDSLPEPGRVPAQVFITLYAFFMVYIMLNVFIAMVLISYARVSPQFSNKVLADIKYKWWDFREKVHTCKELSMYARGLILKNDSNFYFDLYEKKKVGADGDQEEDLEINANPLGEDESQKEPKPSAKKKVVHVPEPAAAAIWDDAVEALLAENRGLLSPTELQILERDIELHLNSCRIDETISKAQALVDGLSVTMSQLEQGSHKASKLVAEMPNTHQQLIRLSKKIIGAMMTLGETDHDWKGLQAQENDEVSCVDTAMSVQANPFYKSRQPPRMTGSRFSKKGLSADDAATETGEATEVSEATEGLSKWLDASDSFVVPTMQPQQQSKFDEPTEGTELSDLSQTESSAQGSITKASNKSDISRWLRTENSALPTIDEGLSERSVGSQRRLRASQRESFDFLKSRTPRSSGADEPSQPRKIRTASGALRDGITAGAANRPGRQPSNDDESEILDSAVPERTRGVVGMRRPKERVKPDESVTSDSAVPERARGATSKRRPKDYDDESEISGSAVPTRTRGMRRPKERVKPDESVTSDSAVPERAREATSKRRPKDYDDESEISGSAVPKRGRATESTRRSQPKKEDLRRVKYDEQVSDDDKVHVTRI